MNDIQQWFKDKKITIPQRVVSETVLLDFNSNKIPLDRFFDYVNKIRLYSTKNIFVKYDDEYGSIGIVLKDTESDADYEKRLRMVKDGADAAKAMRRQQYLALKREFGNE